MDGKLHLPVHEETKRLVWRESYFDTDILVAEEWVDGEWRYKDSNSIIKDESIHPYDRAEVFLLEVLGDDWKDVEVQSELG